MKHCSRTVCIDYMQLVACKELLQQFAPEISTSCHVVDRELLSIAISFTPLVNFVFQGFYVIFYWFVVVQINAGCMKTCIQYLFPEVPRHFLRIV